MTDQARLLTKSSETFVLSATHHAIQSVFCHNNDKQDFTATTAYDRIHRVGFIRFPQADICLKFPQFSNTVFFNLFAAAEPHTRVKVTRGTPCIDPWVQRHMRGWSYRVSTTHFPSRAEPLWGRKSKQKWPILNLITLTGSSTLL